MANYNKRGDRFSELVGLELRGVLSSRGYTSQHVASRIGIHHVSLSRYLNGHRILPSSVISSVCEVVGVNPKEVIERAYERLLDECGPVSDEGYTLAASDHDYDAEIEAMQEEP